MKRFISIISALTLLLCLCSCNDGDKVTDADTSGVTAEAETVGVTLGQEQTYAPDDTAQEAPITPPESEPVSNENITVQQQSARITFNKTTTQISGSGVSADGCRVTVNAPGTYVFSGTADNGRITVNVAKEDEVRLVFNGVNITCADSCPVYIMASDKTVIELAEGSVNILNDAKTYSDINAESEPNASVFSKDDLTIEGKGSLTVNANYNNGITSKNDLKIKEGTLVVTAVHDGLRGKDSVQISGGQITVNAGGDGIKAYETETDGKGNVEISGGKINVTSGQDGIQTDKSCTVSGGTLTLKTGGGSVNSSDKESWGDWGRPGAWGGTSSESQTDTESAKGIKAAEELVISGGDIVIDSSDDSLHSNSNMTLSGGILSLASGDDGAHADNEVTVSGGKIDITKSYEGIEGKIINIAGGTTNITASDDGLNAAGGNDGSAMGRPGMGGFESGSGELNLSGGYLYMNAGGDGLDSNGTVTMSGGTYIVDGPENGGNGPLDYGSGFTVTGGELIAVGSAGMAQNVTNSTQGSMLISVSASAGQKVEVKDSAGNVIMSHTPAKRMQCAVFCHPDLKVGQTYTVTVDDRSAQEVTLSSTVMSSGGMGGGMGGMGGNRPSRPR